MNQSKKTVVLTGGSGFVGKALINVLDQYWNVRRLSRTVGDKYFWNPVIGELSPKLVEDADAVICLSGAPLLRFPWTKKYRRKLVASRINTVNTLGVALRQSGNVPRVFLSGSAIGFYGNTGNEIVNEEFPGGTDFLATLCQRWEEASLGVPAKRNIQVRSGIVLSEDGGIMKALAPLVRWRLAGVIGDGRTWMSTISLRDHVHAISHLLGADVQGAVNLVGPSPVQQDQFMAELAQHYGAKPGCGIPAEDARALLGGMASVLLSSQRVLPKKLRGSGFEFTDPALAEQFDSPIPTQ
ncbi:MAG: TIGR01777 family oxidoreductase [Actinomycetaceae bacterium]|nr:TIGR01777 family oxidoreductase [Actinomycetaceae bacterium]